MPTDKKFTGQRLDSTGLYYYGARYYDPGIWRFISPDTVGPDPKNPQALNRYSYCLNNPLKYNDPSGHWVEFTDAADAWEIFAANAPDIAEMMINAKIMIVLSWEDLGCKTGSWFNPQYPPSGHEHPNGDEIDINFNSNKDAKDFLDSDEKMACVLAHESLHALVEYNYKREDSKFEESCAFRFQIYMQQKMGIVGGVDYNTVRKLDLNQNIDSQSLNIQLDNVINYGGYEKLNRYPINTNGNVDCTGYIKSTFNSYLYPSGTSWQNFLNWASFGNWGLS